jgi:site-specific DNA-methyltransferase (adenine-specific)/modification methylase
VRFYILFEKIEIGNAILYCGDALEVLPSLSREQAALITDPPYGIDFTQRTTGAKITGDDKPFDVLHLLSLGLPTVIWGENYMEQLTGRGRLIWLKRAVEQAAPKSYSDAEIAWTNMINQVKVYRQISDGCIRGGDEFGIVRVHPSQKPIALMKWCIGFAKEAKMIIDPYMGSGSTGVAAVALGLKFTGIEIERSHFETSCKRIEQAQAQLCLYT